MFFHLLKNMLYFTLLVFKGIYHYWICFSRDAKKEKGSVLQQRPEPPEAIAKVRFQGLELCPGPAQRPRSCQRRSFSGSPAEAWDRAPDFWRTHGGWGGGRRGGEGDPKKPLLSP